MKIRIMSSQMKQGMKDENKEHGKSFGVDSETVKKIVEDHLKMDPKYYSKY
jgi:3-methyladenine DNA glycosylase AlkD